MFGVARCVRPAAGVELFEPLKTAEGEPAELAGAALEVGAELEREAELEGGVELKEVDGLGAALEEPDGAGAELVAVAEGAAAAEGPPAAMAR